MLGAGPPLVAPIRLPERCHGQNCPGGNLSDHAECRGAGREPPPQAIRKLPREITLATVMPDGLSGLEEGLAPIKMAGGVRACKRQANPLTPSRGLVHNRSFVNVPISQRF